MGQRRDVVVNNPLLELSGRVRNREYLRVGELTPREMSCRSFTESRLCVPTTEGETCAERSLLVALAKA